MMPLPAWAGPRGPVLSTLDPWQVRRAVLHFIRELLSANAQSCSAWDVVGYIFSEFSQSSSRRVRTACNIFPGEICCQEAGMGACWGHA